MAINFFNVVQRNSALRFQAAAASSALVVGIGEGVSGVAVNLDFDFLPHLIERLAELAIVGGSSKNVSNYNRSSMESAPAMGLLQ